MKRILPFLSLLVLFSCAPEDDFTTPGVTLSPVATNIDLQAVVGMFMQDQERLLTFDRDLVLEAYVVSSDEAGNFYKELVVQDKPEQPVAGINIRLNMASYYQFYNFGRKVYIHLNGLSLGQVNGVTTLGVAEGNQIINIPESQVAFHISRSAEVAAITPRLIKASEFSDALENLYVKIEDVQFNKLLVQAQNPATYAAEENDEFDGERLVESCTGDFPFIISTSTYADFAALKLPAGSGNVQGILTRDFYDEIYTLYMNLPEDISFSNSSRCDPATSSCGLATSRGGKILFEDDFSLQKNNKPVDGKGWKNIVQEGSRQWEAFTATGANASLGRSARMRPAGSGDSRSLSWLITPKINFDANSAEVLSFKTSTSLANGSFMEVLISTDWDGSEENLLKAEWQILSAAKIAAKNDFFGDWISSGLVDLSCIAGKGYIAFRYTGSDHSYYNGVYELDDVMITAE
ncbi:choice-of-anchor J domain-containing protein [Salinimicrobium tongyeongense]|uniref:Choice-of-anchor J domain-containing protein n=1 Tax=Salinimicrobium tongyeongense TaxID=2809707 RepID=A0ABY6NNB6_9FLAO|nr:DUF5689 domain-containing protein [Salinimicrobium tongyeongense]UZH54028.1 choice-of-anchor J domain-containing protein [Salinimicrobium tongyeongense]